MELKEYYGTLSQTINALVDLGYTLDFNVIEDCLVCNKTNTQLSPDDFQIDKIYRFEGMSDPEDQSILYAISSPNFNVKGLLVNAYGMDADEFSAKIIEKLNVQHIPNEETVTPSNSSESPLTELNLTELIAEIKSGEKWSENELVSTPIFKSSTMKIVLMGMKQNAELKSHSAKGVISVQVLIGEIVFTTPEKFVVLKEGQMIALAAGVMHSVNASAESFFLLTMAN